MIKAVHLLFNRLSGLVTFVSTYNSYDVSIKHATAVSETNLPVSACTPSAAALTWPPSDGTPYIDDDNNDIENQSILHSVFEMGFLKEPTKSHRKKPSSQSVQQNTDAAERPLEVNQCAATQVEGSMRKTTDDNSLSCVVICICGPFISRVLSEEIETATTVGLGLANNGQPVTIPLSLNPDEFVAFIWNLFPQLINTTFTLACSRGEDTSRLVPLPSSIRTPAAIHEWHRLGDSPLYICPGHDFTPIPALPVNGVASLHIEPPNGSSDDEDSEPEASGPRRKKRRRRNVSAKHQLTVQGVTSADGLNQGKRTKRHGGAVLSKRGRTRSKAHHSANSQVNEDKRKQKGGGHRGRSKVSRRKGRTCASRRQETAGPSQASSSDEGSPTACKHTDAVSYRSCSRSTSKPGDDTTGYLLVKRSSTLVTSVTCMSRRPDSWTSLSAASSPVSATPSSVGTASSNETIKPTTVRKTSTGTANTPNISYD